MKYLSLEKFRLYSGSIVCLIFGFLQLLQEAGIMATYIYSSLDQTARKINVAKFVNKKVMVMIVTDVAVSLNSML